MNQGKKGGIDVKRTVACLVAVMLAIPAGCAGAFPFSLSVRGGIGMGYYSMSELNTHIGLVRQHYHVAMDDLANGINVNLHGRIWFIDRIAASVVSAGVVDTASVAAGSAGGSTAAGAAKGGGSVSGATGVAG